MAASRAIMLFGTEIEGPPARTLEAGPLTVDFEDGGLRSIRVHGHEAIRGIAYLMRDRNWGTPAAEITELEIEEGESGFTVRYVGRIEAGEVRYRYLAEITGGPEGLAFSVEGQPLSSFLANRCGFIVLHPVLGVAGAAVRVEHTDGRNEETRFPATVSPGQPILDIRALTHTPAPGLALTCRMEAALPSDPAGRFEMEDQRNWSDASFKTYVGSLLDPWPYELRPGQVIRQRVTVTWQGGPAQGGDRDAGRHLGLAAPAGTMPRVGLGLMPETLPEARSALPLAKLLAPRHLTALADLADIDLPRRLEGYRAIAEAVEAPVQLELVLPCEDPPGMELEIAKAMCAAAGLSPAAVIACPRAYLKSYQPSGPWPAVPELREIYAACRSAFPDARVGGGMLTYFTELNRKWPPACAIDFVSHTTSPIVHAADDRSVVQTLEALPAIAASVRAACPGTPYRVGPSAIGMRYNPYGAGTLDNLENVRLAMAAEDPRQRGLFAAAWSTGYAATLAAEGVEALALNHLAGPSGVIAGPSLQPRPWFDSTPTAVVYPVFHVMRALAAASGRPRLEAGTGDRTMPAVAWDGGGTAEILLANLGPLPQSVALERPALGLVLDCGTFDAACCDPAWLDTEPRPLGPTLELDAYAVAFLRLPTA